MQKYFRSGRVFGFLGATLLLAAPSRGGDVELTLRYQTETSDQSGRFHQLHRQESWSPQESAIIVCDVWDSHHCLNAVRRVAEMAPGLNLVLQTARKQGFTIIHAPSDCMPAYADHPARKRAVSAPAAANPPDEIDLWCSRIPAEEKAEYPIDQSDGGEDDDPQEHAEWAAKLKAEGRNPNMPWKAQTDLITIDSSKDYISDRGDEVWNILEERKIKNVILTGVHTNMCVLGRPFGLRQMARNGKNVVLMRDMTDTMYNPQRWPFVSHFTGTDLIISHIERHVCPTITSEVFLNEPPFVYQKDLRPHLAIVVAEDEYRTETSLPVFALRELGKYFRVSYVFGSEQERNDIPGLEVLEQADLALFSIRRRVLARSQMKQVREFVAAGKPVIGIRTASHAFSLRGKDPPAGLQAWPEFDAEVFGGNYTNHHGNKLKSQVFVAADRADHPVLKGLAKASWQQGGSLYQTSPLATGADVLVRGRVEGQPEEPVAWTFTRQDGGCSFYTSLGHPDDFKNEHFVRLLVNGVFWAAGMDPPRTIQLNSGKAQFQSQWSPIQVPGAWARQTGIASSAGDVGWYRCAVRLPANWLEKASVRIQADAGQNRLKLWVNGSLATADDGSWKVDAEAVVPDDANLIVVRIEQQTEDVGLQTAPRITVGEHSLELAGRWQFRLGDESAWSNIPLPAKFGASADIVYQP